MPPVSCRRDDYAYLPSGATAGVDCGRAPSTADDRPDPARVARALFDHLDFPNLRLGMNPQRGLVAVPTWFWVDGYDGGVLSLNDSLRYSHQECRQVTDHSADGKPALAADGSPASHRECTTHWDTLTVDVRVWPESFAWTFGDRESQTISCAQLAGCAQGTGRPFTTARAPSPIAHAYTWSSLGASDLASDAYTVNLGIRFGADYRFAVNGRSGSGWQGLGNRQLDWSTNHQVQEAQAILRRP